MAPLKPPPLRPGDRVAVIAPAGPYDRPRFEAGLAVLSSRYTPVLAEDIGAKHRYLAGDDDRRARELQNALDDEGIKAIFTARGGYGSMRLLPRLKISSRVKPVVGFSDISALHALLTREGWTCLHAPVLTQLGRQGPDVAQNVYDWLENPTPPAPWTGATCFVEGQAEGKLVGGNLSVISRLLGTPYLPSLAGCLLVIEDVGEEPYRLDRIWTHLTLAGVFQQVSGLVLGTFAECEAKNAEYTSLEVVRELAQSTGLPCAQNFPFGHSTPNRALGLGVRARLDATQGRLEFLEGICA